ATDTDETESTDSESVNSSWDLLHTMPEAGEQAGADGGGLQFRGDGRMPGVKLTVLSKELARNPNSYREWRKEIEIIEKIYKVAPADLGPLVYLSLEKGDGQPRELVETLDLDVLSSEVGLRNLMEILDEEFTEKDYERSEKHLRAFEKSRRGIGEDVDDYIARLKTARRNLKVHDPGTRYSDTSFARKLLRSSGLSREAQRQVLAAAGAEWNSEKIEATIKMVYGDVHLDEKRRVDKRNEHPSKHTQYRQFPPRFGQPTSKFTSGGMDADEEFSQDEDYPDYEDEDGQPQDALVAEEAPDNHQEDENEYGEPDSDAMDDEEEVVLDAFYQGFKAKKKQFGRGKGRGKNTTSGGRGKKSGACNDCLQPGHWKGDPECPKVIAGITSPFKPGGKGDGKKSSSSANVAATMATDSTAHMEFKWLNDGAEALPSPHPGPVDAFVLGSQKVKAEVTQESDNRGLDPRRPPTPGSEFEDDSFEKDSDESEGVYKSWTEEQLSAELARRKHKSTGPREELVGRLLRSNLHATFMDEEADGWQDVEKEPSGAAGSADGGKKPKPSARPKPKSTPAASRFQSERIHISGDDVRSLVDRYRARLDEIVVDFTNRARDHHTGYVTDCELEVFRILTAKQLQHKNASSGEVLDNVRWTNTSTWTFAICKNCNRYVQRIPKTNYAKEIRDKAYSREDNKDALVVNDVLWDDIGTTELINDSGCRRSVAGHEWHDNLQAHLKSLGLQPVKKDINEEFRFGGGDVAVSTESFVYPAGINSTHGVIEVARVEGRTPPLLSQQAMQDLGVIVNYRKKVMDIEEAGVIKKPIKQSRSGHFLVDIGEYGNPNEFPECFHINGKMDMTPQEEAGELGFKDLSRVGVLQRGRKKRLQRTTRGVADALAAEAKRSVHKDPPTVKSRSKRWKFLEIFSWTLALSCEASAQGWQVMPPISIETGFDLYTRSGRARAWREVVDNKPDVVAMAWPCDPWTVMHNYQAHRPAFQKELQVRQQQSRGALRFVVKRVADYQRKRGTYFYGENPLTSKAFQEEPIVELLKSHGTTVVDMCAFGLRHPDSDLPIKKPSRIIMSTQTMADKIERRCPGHRQHAKIEGRLATQNMRTSTHAGGYTKEFAEAVISVFTEALDIRFRPDSEEPHLKFYLKLYLKLYRKYPQKILKDNNHRSLKSSKYLRLMRIGGASQLHLDYAKVWQCEVCARRAAPERRRVVSSRQRPTSFGIAVGVDTKELKDASGGKYLALNCVDFATKFSCLIMLENPSSAEAARMFMTKWCAWAGVPIVCHSDNGSEFRKDFASYAESVGITMRVVPTESPWQHGLVERHGAVSNDIVRAIVDECTIQGPAEMELAIAAANICKNRRVDPSGYSPRMRVFGCGDRLPGSVLDSLLSDEQYPEIAVHDAVLKDYQVQRSQKIREAAQVALAKLDNSDKWRKAIVHNYRPTPSPWMPGECVFFWRAAGTFKPQARSTRRADRWHGPAVILGREWGREGQNEEYWLVFNGNLLLVAPQHIRSATPEERLASEAIGSILENYNMDLSGISRGQHTFEAPVVEAVFNQAVETPVPDLDTETLYAMNDVFSLELRPFQAGTKGKELDSRKFTKAEWLGFNKSIAKNWNQHLEHEAVRVVLPDEAAKVDKSRIFKVPARFVHTLKEGQPNRRLVIPGHLDPDNQGKLGIKHAKRMAISSETAGTRTDAPVAPMVGLMLLLNLAAHFGWDLGTFDIGSAFLTGKTNTRRLYVMPPREGLPGVPAGSLVELLKGVFGLRESPRLWWERFSEVLIQAGFQPLKTMKGVFVIRSDKGKIEAVLCVHVDDGLWGGTGERFARAKEIVREKLNVTKEKQGQFEFLGRRINQLPDKSMEVDQHEYIEKMEKIFVPASRRKDPESKATEEELSKYRSLGQQLSWPARTTLPGLAYDVSDLQQRTPDLTVGQLCKANTVLSMAKEMVTRDVKLRFILLLTDEKFEAKKVNVVDWCSSKIHRVVRSTLAAEAASASYGFDRACFVRTALAEILYGWESESDWTTLMGKIPSLCVTDCKSFVDLCRKEGSMPTERRIALDLADLRDRLEVGDGLIWTDTRLMLADPLTKHMKDQSYLEHVLKTGEYVYRCKYEAKAENRGGGDPGE
ncbi:unnamed protein product, partial [Prorocentrum cordatum]